MPPSNETTTTVAACVSAEDTIVCKYCRAELNVRNDRCPKCGGPTKDPMPLLDRPWFMLGLLFLAALVLGLPFLWKSRAFQTPTKIVIAILVTLETIVVFWAFTVTMMWCYRTIMDSLR